MRLILGSQSPRRREILDYFALPFEQISSDFDEESVQFKGNAAEYAIAIARGKAETLSKLYPEAAILSADTVVHQEGRLFGKPANHSEALASLKQLAGKWHSVFTGVVVYSKGKFYSDVEETKVLFNPLTQAQIETYLEALHWADKAGGYAIQLAGSLIVRRIEGCYYNVMGLPINTVEGLLKKTGIDLWDHLK